MRTGTSTINYLLGDHLGSTTITANSSGSEVAEVRYYPWGTERYSSGTTPTSYRFTGQRYETGIGLYYYGARWYDGYLNRWIQPDDIIPNPSNSQDLDRYAYVRNNPTRYIDPTGHWTEEELEEALGKDWRIKYFGEDGVFYGRENLLKFLLSDKTTDPITLEIIRTFFSISADAYRMGLDFSAIDALGARVSVSYGGVGFVSGTFDAILNISSGEFSLFGSPEGGIVIGATGTLVGGITFIKNLPSNAGYRGTAKAVGLMGGDIIGLNAEMFWGGVHKLQYSSDVFKGSFFGAGFAVPYPNIGLYGSMSYAFEVLNVNQAGYNWLPNLPGPIEVISDLGEVLWNDILGLP